jgi:hypothetical protein
MVVDAVRVDHRGARQDLQAGRFLAVREGPVVLVADEQRDGVARLHPRAGKEPALRVTGNPRKGVDLVARIHGADEGVLGTVDRRIAVAGRDARPLDRVVLGAALVAGDDPRPGRAREPLVADLPVGRVGAEEQQRHPRVARGLHGVPLFPGPVLVVADRQERAGAGEMHHPRERHVQVARVAHVVAVSLQKPGEGHFVVAHVRKPVIRRIGPVEAHLHRPAKRKRVGVVSVERLATPGVVRLVGVDARLEQKHRRPIVDDHERREPHEAVVARDLHGVETRHGVRWHGNGRRRVPGAAHQAGGERHGTRRLRGDRHQSTHGHRAGARSAVPAEPIQRPACRVRRIGRRHELDRGAGVDRDVVEVELDLAGVRFTARAPAWIAREQVLRGYGALVSPVLRGHSRSALRWAIRAGPTSF